MKHEKLVKRISIGFNAGEWRKIEEALGVRYHAKGDMLDTIGVVERNSMLRQAIWAICVAIVRGGYSLAPVACELRYETEAEQQERMTAHYGEQMALDFMAKHRKPAPAPRPARQASPWSLDWLKAHFPERWRTA